MIVFLGSVRHVSAILNSLFLEGSASLLNSFVRMLLVARLEISKRFIVDEFEASSQHSCPKSMASESANSCMAQGL